MLWEKVLVGEAVSVVRSSRIILSIIFTGSLCIVNRIFMEGSSLLVKILLHTFFCYSLLFAKPVPHLQISIITRNECNKSFHGSIRRNSTEVKFFTFGLRDHYLTQSSASLGWESHNKSFCTSSLPFYIECEESSLKILYNLTIHICFNGTSNGSILALTIDSHPIEETTLIIKDCNTEPNDDVKIIVENNASYGELGSIHCKNPGFHAISKTSLRKPLDVRCDSSAQWNNFVESDVFCWRDDVARLNILPSVDELSVLRGKVVTFSCAVDKRIPNPSWMVKVNSEKHVLNTNKSLYITRHMDSLKVSCVYWNDYSEEKYGKNETPVTTLQVVYFPSDFKDSSCYYGNNNSTYTVILNISFNAKPEVRQNDVVFQTMINGSFRRNISGTFDKKNLPLHTYTVNINNSEILNSFQFHWAYSLLNCFKSDVHDISLFDCNEKETSMQGTLAYVSSATSVPSATHQPYITSKSIAPRDSLSKGEISGLVVGGTVFVLAVTLIIYCIVKKNGKSDIGKMKESVQGSCESQPTDDAGVKEEVANPLYGTADAITAQKQKKVKKQKVSEKEERVNPVYDPSGFGDDHVEEAYVTGKLNEGFSDGGESKEIYSVVDKKNAGKSRLADGPDNCSAQVKNNRKRKKANKKSEDSIPCDSVQEAMYADVNKKDKKNKKTVPPSASEDTTKDTTYAEVQKKGKKEKVSKMTDAPSTSAQATGNDTYAEVQRKDKKKKKANPNSDDLHGSTKD